MKEFSRYHPIVNVLFFISVIVFSVTMMHPVLSLLSAILSLVAGYMASDKKAIRYNLFLLIMIASFSALMNGFLNNRGETVLLNLLWGDVWTIESLLYGAVSGVMIASVINWFSVINKIMTTDKLLCVFGKITPSLSLIMSMTLRFVPRFIKHIKSVYQANSDEDLKLFDKLKLAVKSFYATVGWAMENSIETADSMRARGYGLGRRTAYSNFKLGKRDASLLCLIMGLDVAIVLLKVFANVSWQYFPKFEFGEIGGFELLFFCVYLALFLLPFIIEVWEVFRWKLLRSKI